MITVKDKTYPWREGMTVADLLEMMGDDYAYAAVRVGDDLVSRIYFETARIPDNVDIYLIPLIAGG